MVSHAGSFSWTLEVVILWLLATHVNELAGENVLGEETEDFDFDGAPGSFHEFKVDVPPSASECFHLSISQGAQLHVRFEVLRGGDQLADFYVYSPSGNHIHEKVDSSRSHFTLLNSTAGVYGICVDTSYSVIFARRLIYVQIMTFAMKEWVDFQTELGEISSIIHDFSTIVEEVQNSVAAMFASQALARFHLMKDLYQLDGNSRYISQWSVAQCALIVVVAGIQVLTVRRLFNTPKLTKTDKPRA